MWQICHTMFAGRLQELREARGFSQESLAREIRRDRATINRWEQGKSSPSVDFLPVIADALGVSVSDLVAHGARVDYEPEKSVNRKIRQNPEDAAERQASGLRHEGV